MQSSSGSTARARAKPTRWRMPPDSSRGYAFSYPSRPIVSMDFMARARSTSWYACWSPHSPSSTFSSTVSHGYSANFWNTIDVPDFTPENGRPRYSGWPRDGAVSPARMRSSVLLPLPDGPGMYTISPSYTSKDTSDTIRTPDTSYDTRRRLDIKSRTSGGGGGGVAACADRVSGRRVRHGGGEAAVARVQASVRGAVSLDELL